MYIDTHTHFDILLKEKRNTEENLLNNDLKYMVQVAVSSKSLEWSYNFALKHQKRGILFTLGLHPSSTAWDTELEQLDNIVEKAYRNHPELLFGIGECGLDYYRMHQEQSMQESSFRHQIFLSKKYNLPLIIHTRDAMEDTLRILEEYKPVQGIMHCFPGDKKAARRAMDLGFYISFAGNVSYKKAETLHESAAYVPLDRLLTETDAPFLTPVPHRGKKNKPDYIKHTYQFLADLRKEPLEKMANGIYENFIKIKNKSL